MGRLVAVAEPGLVAPAGPRFFGFVIGGSLPAATAADVLTGSGAGPAVLGDLTLESSCRAGGFATWAVLVELGRSGVTDRVDRCCALARRVADGLAAGGATVANDVVLNQVLVAFGDDAATDRSVEAVLRAWA